MSVDPKAFIQAQTQIKSPPLVPEIKLHLVTEVMPLWQFTEDRLRQSELPPPYWAIAWPGGQGMARFILDHPFYVMGKNVLDFAAGSGLAAIAAKMAGAKKVLAIDLDPLALEAITLNAELNNVSIDRGAEIDLSQAYTRADIIIAGDICYEQAMSTKLMRWCRLCVENKVQVLIADPGRAYLPDHGISKLALYDVATSRDIEDRDVRAVTVWEVDRTTPAH